MNADPAPEPTMYRIAWNINGRTGFGPWRDEGALDSLRSWIRSQNALCGAGTHWLDGSPAEPESVAALEPEPVATAEQELGLRFGGALEIVLHFDAPGRLGAMTLYGNDGRGDVAFEGPSTLVDRHFLRFLLEEGVYTRAVFYCGSSGVLQRAAQAQRWLDVQRIAASSIDMAASAADLLPQLLKDCAVPDLGIGVDILRARVDLGDAPPAAHAAPVGS